MTSPSAPASRSLWHDRRFRTFWIGETLSQFGDRISELALPLIAVVLLDASATEIGLLTAAVWAPNLLVALRRQLGRPAGAEAAAPDRSGPRPGDRARQRARRVRSRRPHARAPVRRRAPRRDRPGLLLDVVPAVLRQPGRSQPVPRGQLQAERLPLGLVRRRSGGRRRARSGAHCARRGPRRRVDVRRVGGADRPCPRRGAAGRVARRTRSSAGRSTACASSSGIRTCGRASAARRRSTSSRSSPRRCSSSSRAARWASRRA